MMAEEDTHVIAQEGEITQFEMLTTHIHTKALLQVNSVFCRGQWSKRLETISGMSYKIRMTCVLQSCTRDENVGGI